MNRVLDQKSLAVKMVSMSSLLYLLYICIAYFVHYSRYPQAGNLNADQRRILFMVLILCKVLWRELHICKITYANKLTSLVKYCVSFTLNF